MLVLKVGFIVLRLCENDKLEHVRDELLHLIDDEKLKVVVTTLFNNKTIDLSAINSINLPESTENDHLDTFLKAIRTAQKMNKGIIITQEPYFINHSEGDSSEGDK